MYLHQFFKECFSQVSFPVLNSGRGGGALPSTRRRPFQVSGHFFLEMSSLDIALTLVRGPGRLSALALCLAPLLLFFWPTTNWDRPAWNWDRPAWNRDRFTRNRELPAANRDIVRGWISICSRAVSIFGRAASICSRSEKYFHQFRTMLVHLVALNVLNWLDSTLISF